MIECCKIGKNSALEIKGYTSISQLDSVSWDRLLNGQNIYLSTSYLSALEDTLKDSGFRYLMFYDNNDELVGVAYAQIINLSNQKTEPNELYCKLGNGIRDRLLNKMDRKVLVCGNAISTGENGYYHSDKVSSKVFLNHVIKGVQALNKASKEDTSSIFLFKEFWPNSNGLVSNFDQNHFIPFSIDVNMVLPIHASWRKLDDYLSSMKTKFRTKAKSAFKKSAELKVRDLLAQEIVEFKAEIESLYAQVLANADFKFGVLNGNTLAALKENLKEDFNVNGYFLQDKLVGFSTSFMSNNILDANYVGIDYELNHQHAIYQRMLYDFVDQAIKTKSKELRLGRTAEEIKSTLGAEPVNMMLFMKHKNALSNRLISPFIKRIKPSEYKLRTPFKASFYQTIQKANSNNS